MMKVVIQSSIFLVASMLCSSAAILAAEDSHQRAYNSSIHGPNQVYRMEFRTSAVSFGRNYISFPCFFLRLTHTRLSSSFILQRRTIHLMYKLIKTE